jgi:hypothetical protein
MLKTVHELFGEGSGKKKKEIDYIPMTRNEEETYQKAHFFS